MAAILGIALAAAVRWAYFDHVAIIVVHRLEDAVPGREQNALARVGWSYLHLPMVLGIVLVAFGLHEAIAHVDEPLDGVERGRHGRWRRG